MKHSRIAIIGVGAVGSTIAYTLLLRHSVTEIVLIDINTIRCQGEVTDLSDCLSFTRTSKIYQGTYEDAKKADIVIIAAGRAQKPGETREALLETNKKILETIIKNLQGLRSDALIMIVANPLDTLTFYAQQWLDLPPSQIFGTGTFLDSQRLKHFLSCRTGIGIKSIDSLIVGEHGDSQVVAWSYTRIAGNPVEHYGIKEPLKGELATIIKSQAYEIIQAKGATFYGIASCVGELCKIILFDSKQVVPLSTYQSTYGICMSMPVILGQAGVEKAIKCNFTQEELVKIEQSATLLRSRIS